MQHLSIPALVVGTICAIVGIISFCCTLDDVMKEEAKPGTRRFAAKLGKFAAIAFSIAFLFSLVPTRDDIVKAYMMQEGAKLVTAKNADKAVEEFTKRLDKVIEHFTEKK